MSELTILVLLNFVAADFCENRNSGMDTLKSVLVSYSKAVDKWGGEKVRKTITTAPAIEATALSLVVTKCPNKL